MRACPRYRLSGSQYITQCYGVHGSRLRAGRLLPLDTFAMLIDTLFTSAIVALIATVNAAPIPGPTDECYIGLLQICSPPEGDPQIASRGNNGASI